MIQEHSKYNFPDLAKQNDLSFEVNYLDQDEVKNCQIIKWICGDKHGFIERKYLYEFLWAIGKRTDQQKMIPQKVRKTRYIEKFVGVKTTKDIRKGEMLNFKIKLEVPLSEEEIYGEIQRSKSKIIKPL